MKDWTHLTQNHAGKWVALANDEETVLASADSFADVREEARKNGYDDPIFYRVPEEVEMFVGGYEICVQKGR